MLLEPHPELLTAIEHRRIIRLIYHRKKRIVEPHDHGILNGSVQLLGYQVGGSSSRPLPNWILMKTNEIPVWNYWIRSFLEAGRLHPANISIGMNSSSE